MGSFAMPESHFWHRIARSGRLLALAWIVGAVISCDRTKYDEPSFRTYPAGELAPGIPSALASPSGRLWAFVGGRIYVYETDKEGRLDLVRTAEPDNPHLKLLTFVNNGESLVAIDAAVRGLFLIDPVTAGSVSEATIEGMEADCKCLAFADPPVIAVLPTVGSRKLQILELPSLRQVRTIDSLAGIQSIASLSRGRVCCAEESGEASVFDVGNGQLLRSITLTKDGSCQDVCTMAGSGRCAFVIREKREDDRLVILDTEEFSIICDVKLGGMFQMKHCSGSDDLLFVANNVSGFRFHSVTYRVRNKEGAVVKEWHSKGPGVTQAFFLGQGRVVGLTANAELVVWNY